MNILKIIRKPKTYRVIVIKSIIVWVEERLHPGKGRKGVVPILDGDQDGDDNDHH